ncbi:hypothetical protein LVD15_26650 [Fulvivirga maritima]|uniref:hypothetical protein n=1 Tax=Fulvivirga maritima TaxID=2904247 RepID=UPI001F243D27|nr:hypothetical protein [Fulvivirga maritima]UII26829.1 hypothetical protein LVD15_26650 [Fulvivirga maritima]
MDVSEVCCEGVTAKQWGYQGLEVQVQNVEKYDMLHSYVVYTSIKSLYRLNTKSGGLFYVGNDEQREMLMPKGKTAVIISIGYKGDNVFIAFEEFKIGIKSEISMSLKSSSEEEVKGIINSYANYDEENNIEKDLEYMVLFEKEKNRHRTLKLESDFIYRLCLACNPKF